MVAATAVANAAPPCTQLRVYKKVGFEKLPSLKDKAIHDDGYANVIKSVAAFPAAPEGEDGEADATAAEAAEPVPFEEQVKAYRWAGVEEACRSGAGEILGRWVGRREG